MPPAEWAVGTRSRAMPYADAEAQEEDTLLEQSRDGMVRLWDGFVGFAFSGNILQIAFGLMCAPPSLWIHV